MTERHDLAIDFPDRTISSADLRPCSHPGASGATLRLAAALCALLAASSPRPLPAQAATSERATAATPTAIAFPFGDGDTFSGSVPSPSAFFGVPLGSRFTPHRDVVRYCREIARQSPRAQVLKYGESGEGRDLVVLFISSEENIARLEEIRERQLRLADPRRAGEAKVEELIAGLPAVAWLSYNVHGNEAAGTEAALRTIYQLVDGSDDGITQLRRDVVTVVDPLLNPDGRERYRSWYQQVAAPGGNPDPRSREHSEPWPGGRSNHYYFDLNRDWAWLSQPETRARVALYLKWQPLVHVDFHEMGAESSYFFFPAEDPINTNFTKHTTRWGEIFGRGNAAAFDRHGWLYYTTESFDLFYPGYGDSWPSLHGAIGMTYEQAGSGGAGLRYRRRNGEILTLAERLHHHHVAGLATLDTLARRKEELQNSFFEFRRSAAAPRTRGIVEFVIPPDQGQRLDAFVDTLLAQGIEIERTAAECLADSLKDYSGSERGPRKLAPGTLIVPVAQPAGRLVQALLEPRAEITVLRFYDVSAWSLPLAMGLEAWTAPARIDVERQPVTSWARPDGAVEGEARTAYFLPWDGVRAARALHALQRAGLRMWLLPEKIRIGERQFATGGVLVLVARNGGDVHERVREVAAEVGVRFHALDSGYTDDGIDLGSNRVRELAPPRIAVATGTGISSSSFGAIWSLFERELDISFTAFDLEDLGRLRLADYNVIVLPAGWGVRGALEGRAAERVKEWVRNGGSLIALGGSAFALTREATGFTPISSARRDGKKKAEPEPVERKKTEQLRDERRERQVPGNIFRVDLDQDHLLALGLPQHVHAFMSGTRSFALTGGSGDVGAFTDDPAVSGYISEENEKKVARRVYLEEVRSGRGAIVLFAGDPNFRLFWRGLTRLFLNAVFLRAGY